MLAAEQPLAFARVRGKLTFAVGDEALSTADRYTYTVGSLPTITSLSTTSGPAAGGTVVTITGTNLADVNLVQFGTYVAQFAENPRHPHAERAALSGSVFAELTAPAPPERTRASP